MRPGGEVCFWFPSSGDDQKIIGEHGCADQHFEAVAAPQAATLHTAAASQHADASFESGPKLLSALKGAAFLRGCALGGFASATLRNALQRHAGSADQSEIGPTVKAAVGRVDPSPLAELLQVTLQAGLHLQLIGRIALQD
jgi:hypothetical protein